LSIICQFGITSRLPPFVDTGKDCARTVLSFLLPFDAEEAAIIAKVDLSKVNDVMCIRGQCVAAAGGAGKWATVLMAYSVTKGGQAMKKILIIAATLLASPCVETHASEPQQKQLSTGEFLDWAKTAMVKKQEGIQTLKRYRESACSRPIGRTQSDACTAAYNLLIARGQAEMAHLDLWIKAGQVDPAMRDRFLNDVADIANYAQMNSDTDAMFKKVWVIFPDPNYKAK
jgi:hypothetical protein